MSDSAQIRQSAQQLGIALYELPVEDALSLEQEVARRFATPGFRYEQQQLHYALINDSKVVHCDGHREYDYV